MSNPDLAARGALCGVSSLEPDTSLDRASSPIGVIDSFCASSGDERAFFALLGGAVNGDYVFVPLRRDVLLGSQLAEIEPWVCPEAFGTLLNALVWTPRITTSRGNHVVFDDWMQACQNEVFTDFAASDIYSTNAVGTVRRGSRKLVHKAFRFARLRTREIELGNTPSGIGAPVGRYYYVDRFTESKRVLGTLRTYVEGSTLDVPLRASFRRTVRSSTDIVAELVYERSLVERIAEGLFELQCQIAEVAPIPSEPQSVTRIAADVVRRGRDLVKLVEDDPQLGEPLRHLIVSALRVLAIAPVPLPCVESGGMHGDIHFGHIIVSENGIAFIDFENFDIARDAVSTPWKDIVSLARAFEYFSHDELCRVAMNFGWGDELSVARSLVTQMSWPYPPGVLQLIKRSFAWRTILWRTFLEAFATRSALRVDSALLRLLYVQRLFQELQYNYDHARSFYKWFDIYYVLQNATGTLCTL